MTFDTRTRAKLDAALAKTAAARDVYAKLNGDAQAAALTYALDHPARLPDGTAIGMVLGTLPDANWQAMLADSVAQAATPAEKAAMARIAAMPKADAIKVFAFVSENASQFADAAALRKASGKLRDAYAQVESVHPLSVLTKGDKLRVLALARAAAADAALPLQTPSPWQALAPADRIGFYRRVLDAAYPGEQVATLPILPFLGQAQFAAAYIAGADTMIVGKLGDASQTLAMHLVSHEYQHRHQAMRVKKLEAGQLEDGSLDFYRAKLFQINFQGGYISPAVRGPGKLAQLAAIRDYMKQPVENNAFTFGVAFSRAYDPKSGKMLAFATGAQKGIAGALAPVESIIAAFRRLAATSNGNKADMHPAPFKPIRRFGPGL